MGRWAKVFASSYAGTVKDEAALDGVLDKLLASAQDAWPQVALESRDFLAYLAERVPKGEALKQLEGLCVTDLYLARGCVLGQRAALAAFDRQFLSAVEEGVARFDRSKAFADEVKQRVRQKFLVAAPGGVPRLSTYAGLGPLRAWIRAAAYRLAVDLRRQPHADQEE